MLAKGGSAVDAAIAANAALGVIEPMMNRVGGDLRASSRRRECYGELFPKNDHAGSATHLLMNSNLMGISLRDGFGAFLDAND